MKKVFAIIIAISLMSFISYPALAASSKPTPANPYGGTKVDPLGPNETILTISKGKVVTKLSLNKLLKLTPKEISIYEPFVKTRQKFTAVKLSVLFGLVGIKSTDQVSTFALNDYIYKNSAKSFLDAGGYLAFKRDRELISYDQGGPVRIIFPDNSKWSKFLDPWNWSLTKILAK